MSINRRAALTSLGAGLGVLCTARWRQAGALGGGIAIDATCALIVVDVQNCFVKGGTLAVPDGEQVIPVINRLAPTFQNVVLTQDWHPAGHASFASSHPGRHSFETIRLRYGEQVLWPDHCVQGTPDAGLDANLRVPHAQLILRKGFHRDIDSYSAFREADRTTPTGLTAYLQERGIGRVFIAGLATDFCVASTALDARAAGFECYVLEDACRAIDLNGSLDRAWATMLASGVKRIRSEEIATG